MQQSIPAKSAGSRKALQAGCRLGFWGPGEMKLFTAFGQTGQEFLKIPGILPARRGAIRALFDPIIHLSAAIQTQTNGHSSAKPHLVSGIHRHRNHLHRRYGSDPCHGLPPPSFVPTLVNKIYTNPVCDGNTSRQRKISSKP